MGTPTATINYGYTDTNWKDKLTSYNGTAITYDSIGNPLSYRGYTLGWQGRQLTSLSGNGITAASYKYDSSGLRSEKTTNGVTTKFEYVGDKLFYEKRGDRDIYYKYNSFGNLSGITYYVGTTGYSYYVLCNVSGDVYEIYTSSGTLAAKYIYDAWGNIISITDANNQNITDPNHVGNINPIRYRGYYYDAETGLFYVGSRYYDPEIGRWINADSITDGGAGLLGNNLFIYCANNPLNNSDPSGRWIIKNAFKWVAKNIVKPVVKVVQKTLSKTNGTYTKGISAVGTPSIWNFNVQAGISVDTKGNVAIQGTFAGGVTGGSPGASITSYSMTTNAPNIKKLEGTGYQVGGSVGVPVYGVPLSAGAEINIVPDTALNKTYFGTTKSIGLGTPGAEGHVEWGETATWNQTQFNVFDVAKGIYIKIMEW